MELKITLSKEDMSVLMYALGTASAVFFGRDQMPETARRIWELVQKIAQQTEGPQ